MKKDNSDIIEKVKNIVSEESAPKTSKEKKRNYETEEERLIKAEVRQWIYSNANKIAKEIVEKEIKKIFK